MTGKGLVSTGVDDRGRVPSGDLVKREDNPEVGSTGCSGTPRTPVYKTDLQTFTRMINYLDIFNECTFPVLFISVEGAGDRLIGL